jgi:hypothetical protein
MTVLGNFEFGDTVVEEVFKLGQITGISNRAHGLLNLSECDAERFYRFRYGSESHSTRGFGCRVEGQRRSSQSRMWARNPARHRV